MTGGRGCFSRKKDLQKSREQFDKAREDLVNDLAKNETPQKLQTLLDKYWNLKTSLDRWFEDHKHDPGFVAQDNPTHYLDSKRFLDLQLIAQLRETMYFDIGILEVRDRLPHVLPQADTPPAKGQRLRPLGVPFAEDEQLLNPDRPPQHREITGQLLALLPQIESASSPVIFNAALKDLQGQQWSSAPVLNSAGQVVAVYSRLAPPDIKGPPDSKQLRPHATDVRTLRELFP